MSRNSCPINNNILVNGCEVTSCMYYSLLLSKCAHSLLLDSQDIAVISSHKLIDKKKFQQEYRFVKERARCVVILDEYVSYAIDKYSSMTKSVSVGTVNELRTLLNGTILKKLPRHIPIDMIKIIIDENVFEEFKSFKELKSISLQELMFDVPIDSIRGLFG